MLRRLTVAFLIIALASVNGVPLAKADPVNDESLTLYVGFCNMNCSVLLSFILTSPFGPLDTFDFTGEPSFISLTVTCYPLLQHYSTEIHLTPYDFVVYNVSSATEVVIYLDRSEQQGRSKADAFKEKIEELLNVYLVYDEILSSSLSSLGTVCYYYISQVPAIEDLWDAFQRQEFQGLSKLISSGLDCKNVQMTLSLEKRGSSYMWSYQILDGWLKRFSVELEQEYTISLSEMLGHVGDIRSASEALASNLYFTINTNITLATQSRPCVLVPVETMPEMIATQDDLDRITFHADVTGVSIGDFMLRFKIVEKGYDLTTICAAALIIGASLIVVVFIIKRRRRFRYTRYRR
jgi:hypothetical protein